MSDKIARIESYTVTIPRETPYLGDPGPGDRLTTSGYLIRAGNRTIYPMFDRSVVVRVTTRSGRCGWGETYGLVAPDVVHALVDDVIAPLLVDTPLADPADTWDGFYDLMRVRGYQGGFWLDAVAAVDIALWDLAAQLAGQPLYRLLGGPRRDSIPAYVSGLPKSKREERIALALDFRQRGFDSFKIAAVTTPDDIEDEVAALREAMGADVRLMVDLHWMFSPADAIDLLKRLEPYNLFFAEAPCVPEDVAGLAKVAAASARPIAAGEEWRTTWDAKPRLEAKAVGYVQPEMGHTGVTQFMRITAIAGTHDVPTIPHATIGVGIFLAASLHASAAVEELPMHEYQHSILDRNAGLLDGRLECREGRYALPEGPGLGVAPNDAMWHYVKQ